MSPNLCVLIVASEYCATPNSCWISSITGQPSRRKGGAQVWQDLAPTEFVRQRMCSDLRAIYKRTPLRISIVNPTRLEFSGRDTTICPFSGLNIVNRRRGAAPQKAHKQIDITRCQVRSPHSAIRVSRNRLFRSKAFCGSHFFSGRILFSSRSFY